MMHSVLAKTLRDQRRGLVVWVLAFVGLVGLYVAVYPSVKGDSSFAKLIDQMPPAYRALFSASSGADFTTAAGYLNTELLSFMAPMLVLLYAIGSGSSAIAGEEDRRTLDLLLANPVSRQRVLIGKLGALAAGIVLILTALWFALIVEGRAAGMTVPPGKSASALLHLGLLGVEFGAIALLVGALTGHLTLSKVVAAVVAVLAYLLNALAPLVSWLRPFRKLSPFYQYIGHDPLRTGLSVTAALVSVASIAVLSVGAAIAFSRRDVLA